MYVYFALKKDIFEDALILKLTPEKEIYCGYQLFLVLHYRIWVSKLYFHLQIVM